MGRLVGGIAFGLLLAALSAPSARAADEYIASFSTQYTADVIPGGKVGTYTSIGFIVDGRNVFYELTPFIEDLSFTKGKMTTLGTRQCRSTKGNSGNEQFLNYQMCLKVTQKSDGVFEVTAEEITSSIEMPQSPDAVRLSISHSETVRITRGGGSCRIELIASAKTYKADNPPLSYAVKGGQLKGRLKCSVRSGNIGG